MSHPVQRFGGYAETGWLLVAGGSFPLGGGHGLGVAVEGFTGSNALDLPGDKVSLMGGLVGIEYQPVVRRGNTVVVFAMVGILQRSEESGYSAVFDRDGTGLGFTGGVRYCVPLKGVQGCLTGRFLGGLVEGEDGNPNVLGLTTGVRVPLGGG